MKKYLLGCFLLTGICSLHAQNTTKTGLLVKEVEKLVQSSPVNSHNGLVVIDYITGKQESFTSGDALKLVGLSSGVADGVMNETQHCEQVSVITFITPDGTFVKKFNEGQTPSATAKTSLLPNPATNGQTLQLSAALNYPVVVTVHDMRGQKISSVTILFPSGYILKYPSKGNYLVNILEADGNTQALRSIKL